MNFLGKTALFLALGLSSQILANEGIYFNRWGDISQNQQDYMVTLKGELLGTLQITLKADPRDPLERSNEIIWVNGGKPLSKKVLASIISWALHQLDSMHHFKGNYSAIVVVEGDQDLATVLLGSPDFKATLFSFEPERSQIRVQRFLGN